MIKEKFFSINWLHIFILGTKSNTHLHTHTHTHNIFTLLLLDVGICPQYPIVSHLKKTRVIDNANVPKHSPKVTKLHDCKQ